MSEAVPHAGSSRHVVFPDAAGGYGRALNLAPLPPLGRAAGPADAAPRADLPAEARSFIRWLFSRAGMDSRCYKPETLARRLPAGLRALGATSPAQARATLERHPHLTSAALDAMLIGVTRFFRDETVFTSLRRRILPELLRRRSAGEGRPVRIWSAGCSDGAELYSVALLLADVGALLPGRFELLGTDCRPEALETAAAGVFAPASVKAVPPALLRACFRFDGTHYQVHRALRAMLQWRQADALAAPEPGAWDLVLCRNLAIYLQPRAAAALWSNLAAAVRVGGALVLGKAERPLGVAGLLPEGSCTYRRVAEGERCGT
jgi:chemotaxis methyl-accepting protein methylase